MKDLWGFFVGGIIGFAFFWWVLRPIIDHIFKSKMGGEG
jgi:hypothetical protein